MLEELLEGAVERARSPAPVVAPSHHDGDGEGCYPGRQTTEPTMERLQQRVPELVREEMPSAGRAARAALSGVRSPCEESAALPAPLVLEDAQSPGRTPSHAEGAVLHFVAGACAG